MVFANISSVIVLLFNIFDILVADEAILNGVNQRNYQKHLACKEGYPSAFCIPPEYNRDIGPWEYRHLTNMSLPWLFTMEFYMYDVQEIDDEKLTITFLSGLSFNQLSTITCWTPVLWKTEKCRCWNKEGERRSLDNGETNTNSGLQLI